jgi:hypothetical protein
MTRRTLIALTCVFAASSLGALPAVRAAEEPAKEPARRPLLVGRIESVSRCRQSLTLAKGPGAKEPVQVSLQGAAFDRDGRPAASPSLAAGALVAVYGNWNCKRPGATAERVTVLAPAEAGRTLVTVGKIVQLTCKGHLAVVPDGACSRSRVVLSWLGARPMGGRLFEEIQEGARVAVYGKQAAEGGETTVTEILLVPAPESDQAG